MAEPCQKLFVAYVTRANALKYCSGAWDAGDLWASALEPENGERRDVLFCNGLRGKMAWRHFAAVTDLLPPAGLCFASRIPSILKRCGQFGAELMRAEDTPEGPLFYYFAEGDALRAFLDALCRQRGEQCLQSTRDAVY